MAATTSATPLKKAVSDQESEQSPEEISQQQGTPRGSFLDPDVLIILPLAILVDILDFLVIGVFANLVLGWFFILWMIWKTGSLESAKGQIQNTRQAQQARQAARKRATGRALRRGTRFFLTGLFPIVSAFTFWTWAVINTVRGK